MPNLIQLILVIRQKKYSKKNNVESIIGEFIATSKNKLIENIYSDHGFINDRGRWVLKGEKKIKFPEWIELVIQ